MGDFLDAFAELRKAVGDAWDGVNVLRFVCEQRHDNGCICWVPCQHLTWDEVIYRPHLGDQVILQHCLLCGLTWERTAVLVQFRKAIQSRHRLTLTAAERADDYGRLG